MTDQNLLAARFEEHRPRLRRLATRMLGSDAQADDALQETWLRLSRAGDDDVENLGGWLTTVTSRVCLNQLRARATRNETAYEDRTTEPVVESVAGDGDPAESAELAEAVETALLLVLDRLTPAERVAFVLHDTFDVPYAQIGELLDRSTQATRQLASRARRRVREANPSSPPAVRARGIVDAFFAAARAGDFDRLVSVLAPDVMLRAEGIAPAAVIVRGATNVAGRALMFANPGAVLQPVVIDGNPGVIVLVEKTPVTLMAFQVDGDRVSRIDSYSGAKRLATITLP
jgi:RNA polymerase sigma factor (sigma-70 family)